MLADRKDMFDLQPHDGDNASVAQAMEILGELASAVQGQEAGFSAERLQGAIVSAARRLLRADAARLLLLALDDAGPVHVGEGLPADAVAFLEEAPLADLRDETLHGAAPRSLRAPEGVGWPFGSVVMAPILIQGRTFGVLEAHAFGGHLDSDTSRALLRNLAAHASLALDNSLLCRELDVQSRQLRSYVENVIETEEQDTRRLALDLHDGLVQTIVASYQHLQSAQAWRGRDPGQEEREIGEGVTLLRQAIHEARGLIARLRPAGLDDLGLVHALRLYVAQLMADASWQVSLEVAPDWPSLPPALEAAFFRIVQEALTNAQRYADASRALIRLEVDGAQLHAMIRDWGKGFDPTQVPAEPEKGIHMGLIGIRERARLWGGRCIINSQPGKGTSIHVAIPLGALADCREGAK
ncbi:MAG: GAF domain-containing sensor histidine kinase [Anaerolineae bacterium]